ncbi:MAG: DNA polymerase III subunit delta [Tenericutes bacterium]|nr:DNA polymerase III subunit delta [Mycoplasmatota bacterium]
MNANCILYYGNDSYLIKKTMDELFQSHEIKEEDIENYDYEEDGIEVAVTSAMTMPFLSDKKAVILRNCIFLSEKKSATVDDITRLEGYCSFKNPTTIFVLLAPYEKLDQRKKIVKFLIKHIDSKAFVQNKKSDSIYDYVREEVKRNNLSIDPLALTQFVNRIGNDSQMLENELNKLITYSLNKEVITSDMVYAVVTKDIDDNIFELVNAFLAKDLERTMSIYLDLKSIKIDPIWILSVIVNKFQEILYTKELIKMKYKNEDIAKYFRASKGRTYYIMQNARNVEDTKLMELLQDAGELDYKIKSGQIEKELGMELFLLKSE